MRFSQLFGQTLRDAPSDAVTASHKLLTRAAYLRPLGAGQFALLPFGQRSLAKIAALARRHLDALGGQEMALLTSAPPNLRDLTGLVEREVQSYKHLPRLLYAIHNYPAPADWPPSGLLPGRTAQWLTILGLESSAGQNGQPAQTILEVMHHLLTACGVQSLCAWRGGQTQALFAATDAGETALLGCDTCGNIYAQSTAPFQRPPTPPDAPRPVEKVFTPQCKTIAELADYLNIPTAQTAKAILLMARLESTGREQFVFAVVRGDTDLSEPKLSAALGAESLRPATEEEIRVVGAVPGFASPVGLKSVFVVVDTAVAATPNLVSGANEADYHLRNVNYGRDYTAQVVADIAAAPDDAACPHCAAPMRRFFATEIARLTTLEQAAAFLDRDGKPKPTTLTLSTLDLTRLLACAAEQHHDERGLTLPISIAPFQTHIVALKGGFEMAEQLYTRLTEQGVDVFYDDRDDSPGVKFNDADLIGLPIRVTVAEKSLAQGGVEFKLRSESERRVVGSAEAAAEVIAAVRALRSAVAAPDAPHPHND